MASPTNQPAPYCPERGDIIWLDFDPILGNEQAKQRPAFVVTKRAFNALYHLCLACPITSTNRGDPFDVVLPATLQIANSVGGVVRSHHLRSMSWEKRGSQFIVRAPNLTIADVLAKIKTLAS